MNSSVILMKRYKFFWLAGSKKAKGVSGGHKWVIADTLGAAIHKARREIQAKEIAWMLEKAESEDIEIYLSLEKVVEI